MDRVISFVIGTVVTVLVLLGVAAAVWYAIAVAVAYWAPSHFSLYLDEFPIWKMAAIVFSIRTLIYVIWDR